MVLDPADPTAFLADGRAFHTSWYRGKSCNYWPAKASIDSIVKGWAPPQPVIKKNSAIISVGSCFARSISDYLREHRKDIKVQSGTVSLFMIPGGFVNTATILQQFEWALNGRKLDENCLWSQHPRSFSERSAGTVHHKRWFHLPVDEETRKRTARAISSANVFIFTIGLSEVWVNKKTGDVFLKAVPGDIFDPAIHEFKILSVDENVQNLQKLIKIIRSTKPTAPIILSLSPIPLQATFRNMSCETASEVSKAILRVALDEVFRMSLPGVYYWPSYEIVRWIFGMAAFEPDMRHLKPAIIKIIMEQFEKFFIEGARVQTKRKRRLRGIPMERNQK